MSAIDIERLALAATEAVDQDGNINWEWVVAAVLTALREPGEVMIAAMRPYCEDDNGRVCADLEEMWKAAIDHLLDE